jgi:hypothetical protein
MREGAGRGGAEAGGGREAPRDAPGREGDEGLIIARSWYRL